MNDWTLVEVVDLEYPVTYLIKIDIKNLWWLQKYEIHISRSKKTHRPKRLKLIINGEYFTLHRLIKKTKKPITLHHKNMNHLDVREVNLEEMPFRQHMDLHKYIYPNNNIKFAPKMFVIDTPEVIKCQDLC